MSNPNAKSQQSPSHAALTHGLLHELEVIEGSVRGSGLPHEADELHSISERLRSAMSSEGDECASSMRDARKVLEEIHRERSESPCQDIQRALA